MKRCIIYAFSGTGNTVRVAHYYETYLRATYEVIIYRICTPFDSAPDPTTADLIGFGYPIHAFNAPEAMIRFARQLAPVNNTPTFIYETSGEGLHVNDASSVTLRKIISRKGYDVLTDRHYVMPYNMILRHTDAMVKHMVIYARTLVKINAQELMAGMREKHKAHPFLFVLSLIFRIEWLYAKIQGPAMRVDMDTCIKCNRCIRDCPVKNISYNTDGRIVMGTACTLCVACSFNCPVDAISIGLLNKWKVNGQYQFDRILKDAQLPFPYITDTTKGGYRVYRKYYREADERIARAGATLETE
ncbi:MAG: EFR1 family ferrodoxin [Treponema sp.]|nr:EFR1 family ferrodoxin [Treponema sp.]